MHEVLHKKSKCCGAKIIRFGGKRRQCTVCKKTWTIHPAKQGRKSSRQQYNYLIKVFKHGFTVKQLSLYFKLSTDVIYKRFSRNLNLIAK